MNGLLSAGLLVLAFVVGRESLPGSLIPALRRSLLALHTLSLVLGIALLTPILVVVASVGQFRLPWLGAVGWIAAVATIAFHARSSKSLHARPQLDAADIVVLTAAVLFAVIAATGRDETLGAGRDQQVYAEAAVALAERGTASVKYERLDDADRTLLRNVSGVQIPDVTDTRAGVDRPITLRHPLGWPAWLALAHAAFGIQGVYAANSVVFALAGLLFFVLLRLFMHAAVAVAGTILLFALPSSLWISGISLSEPSAMLLLLAVPLIGTSGWHRSCWPILVLLVAATLIRLDSALAVPAVMCAALLSKHVSATRTESRSVRRFALAQSVGLAVTLLAYRAFYPAYLRITFGYVAAIVAASLTLTLAAFILTPGAIATLRRMIDSRVVRIVMAVVLVSVFFYAIAIRPNIEPFSIIHQGSGLDGTRDFREDSVRNLATYLSWPILFAALGGVFYGLWQRWASRGGPLRCIVLILGIGPALLYLWYPYVSPDHPWAVRRFVPTVIPYAILFASIFVHALTRRLGRTGAAIGALSIAAPYGLIAADFPVSRLLVQENAGVTKQIAEIANELPDTLVVTYGVDENVAAALLVAYGKPVVFLKGDLSEPNDVAEVSRWIVSRIRSGRPAWLLHGPQLWHTGAEITERRDWWVTRRYLQRSDHPPATQTSSQDFQVILSEIRDTDPSFATRLFGGERMWNVPERGFLETEVGPLGMFRHTDGLAWIDVPSRALHDARMLKIDVLGDGKAGERHRLDVLINDTAIWEGSVGSDVTTLRIPMPSVRPDGVARIELLSDRIDPAKANGEGPRQDLGISLMGIRPLQAGEPVANRPGIAGFRSALAFVGLPPGSRRVAFGSATDFVLDIRNVGNQYWPTAKELGGPAGAVQIALRWYRRDVTNVPVGDNRWPLSISLLPGDRTRVRVPLVPLDLDGKRLPSGEYEVHVEMVRETVAFFSDNGDAVLSIPVLIAP